MKRVAIVPFVALILMACGSGRDVRAEEIKIGSVNFQQALNEVEQGKRAKAALKSEFDAKQKKLGVQQDELKKMQDEAQKQAQVLSKEAMAEKQRAFQEKLMTLQKNMGDYRDELVQKEAKMTGQILKNLKTVVGEVGQKEGYTLIMETSQDSVLYARTQEDLTSRMIKLYNQKFTGPLKTD